MDLEPFHEAVSLMESGEYKTALSLLNTLRSNKIYIILADLISADIHIFTGDFSKAKRILANRNISEEIDLLPYITLYQTILDSSFLLRFNKSDQAYHLLKKLDISEMSQPVDPMLKQWISRFYHTLGNTALALGNFQEAEQSYNSAIALRRRDKDFKGLSSSLNKLSSVHRMLGNLDLSESHILEALEIEERLANQQAIGVVCCTLGILMRQKGKHKQAVDFFEQAISMLKLQDNPFLVSVAKYELFLTIVHNDEHYALKIENAMEKIVKDHPDNIRIEIIFQIIHAIRLQLSKRGIEKYEGQQILKNLQNTTIEDISLKITISARLIFSLIEEYKAFGDQNILDEIKELIEQLYQIASTNNSKYLEGEVMLIKANLELISGNVNGADDLMNQAEKFAEGLNLSNLVERIQGSKARFEKELTYWNDVIKTNSSILDRVTKSGLGSYLEKVLELTESGLIGEERG